MKRRYKMRGSFKVLIHGPIMKALERLIDQDPKVGAERDFLIYLATAIEKWEKKYYKFETGSQPVEKA